MGKAESADRKRLIAVTGWAIASVLAVALAAVSLAFSITLDRTQHNIKKISELETRLVLVEYIQKEQ